MDLLSDVLRVVHLQGAIFFTAEIAGRWAVQSPAREELARLLGMREECVALFHLVDEGECQIALGGGAPIAVGPGSIVIFPRADRHRIASDPSVPPIPIESIFSSCSGPEVPSLRRGTDGARFRLICGYLRCDQRFNPLVGALPPLLIDRPEAGQLEVISGGDDPGFRTEKADGGGWLAQTFRHAVEEAQARRPGSAVMLPRLAEVMYVEVLCGATCGSCPRAEPAGSPPAATRRSATRSGAFTRSPPAPGAWRISPARSGCRDRCWGSASKASWESLRCATWRSGASTWPSSCCMSRG